MNGGETPGDSRIAELYKLASLGRMLAGVLHEINTPLASIASNSAVYERSLASLKAMELPGPAAGLITRLESLLAVDRIAIDRIAGVIRGVKMLVRGEQSEPSEADLNAILQDTLKVVQHEFKRRIQVVTDFGHIPPVPCYPHLLGQVFVNLLVNAAHAIEGEGTVTIRTGREHGTARIAISDTGRGIAPAHRDRIFAAGFTTKPPGLGTGLGLAISKEIVESHGGTIEFESREGAGTTFYVRIPLRGAA